MIGLPLAVAFDDVPDDVAYGRLTRPPAIVGVACVSGCAPFAVDGGFVSATRDHNHGDAGGVHLRPCPTNPMLCGGLASFCAWLACVIDDENGWRVPAFGVHLRQFFDQFVDLRL